MEKEIYFDKTNIWLAAIVFIIGIVLLIPAFNSSVELHVKLIFCALGAMVLGSSVFLGSIQIKVYKNKIVRNTIFGSTKILFKEIKTMHPDVSSDVDTPTMYIFKSKTGKKIITINSNVYYLIKKLIK